MTADLRVWRSLSSRKRVLERERIIKKKAFIILLAAVLIPAGAQAGFDKGQQKYYAVDEVNPYFDKNNVVTTSGKVVSIITVPIPMNKYVTVPGMGLVVLLPNKQNLPVQLGPFWYIFEKKAEFNIGDEVQLKGAIMKDQSGNDYMVATKITSGTVSIGFRDDFGVPLWQYYSGSLDMFNQE